MIASSVRGHNRGVDVWRMGWMTLEGFGQQLVSPPSLGTAPMKLQLEHRSLK